MKKTLKKISLLTIAASMMFACSPFEPEIPDVEEPVPGEDPAEVITRDVTFSATTETMSEWAVGDKISIFDGKAVLTATNTDAGTIAKFPVTLSEGFTSFLAFYPENSNIGASEASYSIAGTQTGVAGSYEKSVMSFIAKGKTNKLYFRELGAKLSFVLDMDNAQSITIKAANGAKLTGSFAVDFSGENPVVTPGTATDEVVVNGPFTKGETYIAVVLPSEIDGYTMVVKNKAGEEIAHHTSATKISTTSGQTSALDEIKADNDLPKVFKITHVWLWGGTGPEYSCSKVYDLFAKAGSFDATDGRGVEAMKDDVLELCPDGTLNNWAGADGLHWWMAFNKDYTPTKYKALDVVDKYGVLPKNTGTWASEDGVNFTFTKEDGTQTTAQLVPAGTYDMPGTSNNLKVTINTMALKFTVANSKDYWDNPASDYDVFYMRPRQLFVEVEQMPAGYITPEENKTKDEVVFVEPDDPAPSFDITKLPGSYTVCDLQVNGGSGSDATWVGPVDKSWCWDDSIWKESDNQLVIKVTGQNGNVYTGTINYWAGNDGQFWNYKWHGGKDDEVDMSWAYGKLPHGEKSFEFNADTREAVIDGNVKCTVYGEYEKVKDCLDREKQVNPNSIALVFHLMDPIAATSSQWTDVDRFVNAPIDYYMSFTKND